MVEFDALEESFFPFIISNFPGSIISSSICQNWGVFHTVVAGIQLLSLLWLGFPPEDWLDVTGSCRREPGTVLRLGHV